MMQQLQTTSEIARNSNPQENMLQTLFEPGFEHSLTLPQ